MAIVDVRNVPTIIEVGPSSIVADFTEEQVVAQVMVGPTVVEFSWGELVPEPGLRGGGPFEGTVTIGPWIPGLPETTEAVDPVLDRIMVWDESMQMHVQRPAALGGGGGGADIEFATREETDAGILTTKALNPDVGAYAYDRFRWVGQHEAGKGTATVTLVPIAGVVTVDQALSNVFDITATENLHFADPVNPILGQTVNISIRQDIVGGHTATWGDKWTFTNKITPVLSTAPLAVDMVSCQWNETDEVMRCSFLPNFGANFEAPPVIGIEDLNFVNLGGGNEVLKGQVVADVQFRTITGGGDINVSTVNDNIVISYTPPAPTIEVLDDVNDVDTATAAAGDVLTYDGENWVNAAPRRYTVGATWTNGTQEVGTPINEVSCVVSERSQIAKWTILTDGLYGSCQLDVRRVTLGNFPPLTTDTICNGNKPLIAGGFSAEDDSLVGWDTVCEEGDILQFVLETTNNFTTVQLLLTMERIP